MKEDTNEKLGSRRTPVVSAAELATASSLILYLPYASVIVSSASYSIASSVSGDASELDYF
jgi:hypothetical protein